MRKREGPYPAVGLIDVLGDLGGNTMHLPTIARTSEGSFKMTGAWFEGARGYYTIGVKREDCPYNDGRERTEWLDGWDEEAFYGGWEQTKGLFELESPNA